MKIRADYVTNSSSSCFVVVNISDTTKTIKNFLIEAKEQLLGAIKEKFIDNMDDEEGINIDKEVLDIYNDFITSYGDRKIKSKGVEGWVGYDGDYDDELINNLDYMGGGFSKSFIWGGFSTG